MYVLFNLYYFRLLFSRQYAKYYDVCYATDHCIRSRNAIYTTQGLQRPRYSAHTLVPMRSTKK